MTKGFTQKTLGFKNATLCPGEMRKGRASSKNEVSGFLSCYHYLADTIYFAVLDIGSLRTSR